MWQNFIRIKFAFQTEGYSPPCFRIQKGNLIVTYIHIQQQDTDYRVFPPPPHFVLTEFRPILLQGLRESNTAKYSDRESSSDFRGNLADLQNDINITAFV